MKKTIYYILGVAALLAVASCQKNLFENENEVSSEGISITFTCGEMPTRAAGDEVPGVNNENLIKRIDYFIFPCDDEGVVADNAVAAYRDVIIPEDDGLGMEYTTGDITTGALNQIFPNGASKAVIFAVANFVDYYGSAVAEPATTIADDLTWAELQALEVGQSFFEDGGDGFELRWPRVMNPDNANLFFVMVGKKVVEFQKSGKYAIEATIDLERLASKVTAVFDYAPQVIEYDKDDVPKVKWIPMDEDEETRVYLSNGVEHATLGGPLTRTLVTTDSWAVTTKPNVHNGTVGDGSRDIFEYAYDYMNDITTMVDIKDEDGEVVATRKQAHYYTYPISLEEGDDSQPYLKLVLPWIGYNYLGKDPDTGNDVYSAEATKMKEVYYKIVLPRETINEPNKIYEFEVYVDIVGSDKEVNITGEKYIVKDWSHDNEVSSNVGMGRYISLDIPKDEYDMYTSLVEILYVSSGEVEIYDLKIEQEDFYAGTVKQFITGVDDNGDFTYGTGYNANTPDAADPANPLSEWVTVESQYLVINHQMNNNFSASKFDVAPMTFTVTLHLKGEPDHSFDRTVSITQYPALYATRDAHIGKVFVNGQTNDANNSNTYVQATDNSGGNLGSIQAQGANGLPGGANSNPNNYTVYVSTLSGFSQPWVIGDPRDTPAGISVLGVENYRKTRTDASKTIAPSFKIASSYGQIRQNVPTFNQATNRCAAYQENGYPAGRWRVPTEAEIEFCVELSNKEMIPSLFNYSYWASSGRYYNYQDGWHNGGTNTTAAVRCVYDVWFWGEEKSDACTNDGGTTYNVWGDYQD